MMPKSSEIEGLLSRLEAATGPDREIDIDLCLALNYVDSTDEPPLNLRRAQDDEGWLDYEVVEDGKLIACTDCAPRLTASIDAALALVERMLPGSEVLVRTYPWRPKRLAWVAPTQEDPPHEGWAETAPLAIILALLHALSARPRP